jgi:hypothetical protein
LALKQLQDKTKNKHIQSFIIIFFVGQISVVPTDFILTSQDQFFQSTVVFLLIFPEINFFLENSSSECLFYYNYSFNNSSVSSFSCMSLRKIVREYLFPGKDYLGKTYIIKERSEKEFFTELSKKIYDYHCFITSHFPQFPLIQYTLNLVLINRMSNNLDHEESL